MHIEVIQKIKYLRERKNISLQEMADLLHLDIISYKILESGKTNIWTKYLNELLIIFEISVDDFFKGISTKVSIENTKGSFGSNNLHIENIYPDNTENNIRIEKIYEARIKDKDILISYLQKYIEDLKRN